MLWILFLILLIAGFYWAAFEAVLLFSEPARIEKWQEAGRPEADFLSHQFLNQPGRYLSGLRLTRLLLFLVLFLVLFFLLKSLALNSGWGLEWNWMGILFLAGLVIYFLIFDIFGKIFGILHSDRLLGPAALAARITAFLAGPLLLSFSWLGGWFFPGADQEVSRGSLVLKKEIRFLGMPAAGEISEGEKKAMLFSVFEFGRQMVKSVMTPRTDMVCLDVQSSPEQIRLVVVKCGYSRIPVFENEVDNILGILYVKDLFKTGFMAGAFKLHEILRPPQFVPETKRVDKLLREMKISKNHIALVVDEYGGISGLVTFEDLIEEIIGEINDEYDQEPAPYWRSLGGGNFMFMGDLPLGEAAKILGTWISEKNYDTIGGFILGVLGRIPQPQESISYENYTFVVEEVEDRRIKSLKVIKND